MACAPLLAACAKSFVPPMHPSAWKPLVRQSTPRRQAQHAIFLRLTEKGSSPHAQGLNGRPDHDLDIFIVSISDLFQTWPCK